MTTQLNKLRGGSVTEAPARYRAWTSHYPGERATDYTTGTSRGHQRVSPEGEPCETQHISAVTSLILTKF